MLPSVIGTIGSVPFGHHGPGRFASMPRRSIRTSIPGSKSVPSRNWSRWDLVKNTLYGIQWCGLGSAISSNS
jgi:hypothetical protein